MGVRFGRKHAVLVGVAFAAADPETDRCSLFIWGGCQGNDNNFESAAECAQACDASPLPLAAYEVGGVLFSERRGENCVGDVCLNRCG